MKKFSYLLMAAFAVMCVCSSCSKDEDEGGNVDSQSIVGTWKAVSTEGYEIYDGEKEEWKEVYGNDDYLEITFNADGTGREIYRGRDYEYTDKFNWTLSGNKLSIKYAGEGEVESLKVESLTSKQLVIVSDWVSSDGMEKEYEKTTFTRVK